VAQALLGSLVLLALNAAVLLLIVLDESQKVDKFQSRFRSFTEKKFLVYR
jgi:hypothetical protein